MMIRQRNALKSPNRLTTSWLYANKQTKKQSLGILFLFAFFCWSLLLYIYISISFNPNDLWTNWVCFFTFLSLCCLPSLVLPVPWSQIFTIHPSFDAVRTIRFSGFALFLPYHRHIWSKYIATICYVRVFVCACAVEELKEQTKTSTNMCFFHVIQIARKHIHEMFELSFWFGNEFNHSELCQRIIWIAV